MNPGLISHFTLKAIEDIAKLAIENRPDNELKMMLEKKEWAKMSKKLGVEIVHCSEIDTQIAKNVDVNNSD